MAEATSACTCEICGEPGRLHGPGWLTTRCATHAEGRSPVAVRHGFDNIHIVRYVVGGESRITCRRYDRETDAFVDDDPAKLIDGGHLKTVIIANPVNRCPTKVVLADKVE